MNGFSWTRAIGFGVAIWLIMFALVWVSMGLGLFSYVATQLVLAVIMGLLAYAFASLSEERTGAQSLGYGVMFAAVGLLLDLLLSRLAYPGLYGLWTYYVGYALVLFAPWFRYSIQAPTTRAV